MNIANSLESRVNIIRETQYIDLIVGFIEVNVNYNSLKGSNKNSS